MTGAARVLVVDDDPTVAEVVHSYLDRAGLAVTRAADGVTAMDVARRTHPDLVVLDLMLPGMSGLEVCRRLREVRPDVAVVMLTALGEESDRIVGLETGADDYLVKPFSLDELVARVTTVLRRTGTSKERVNVLRCADLTMDDDAHVVMRGEREIVVGMGAEVLDEVLGRAIERRLRLGGER